MFWTILLIALPLAVLVVGGYKAHRSRHLRYYASGRTRWPDVIGCAIGALVLAAFVGLIGSAAVEPERVRFENHYPLKAIQDNSEMHGSFFLASGGFGEDMRYYYYVERNGAYRLEDIDPSFNVGVIEGPKAELIEKGYTNKGTFWAWGANFGPVVTDTIFSVPNGTIKQDYTLDAKK